MKKIVLKSIKLKQVLSPHPGNIPFGITRCGWCKKEKEVIWPQFTHHNCRECFSSDSYKSLLNLHCSSNHLFQLIPNRDVVIIGKCWLFINTTTLTK